MVVLVNNRGCFLLFEILSEALMSSVREAVVCLLAGCREADGVPGCSGEQQRIKVLPRVSHPVGDRLSGGAALADLPGKHTAAFCLLSLVPFVLA